MPEEGPGRAAAEGQAGAANEQIQDEAEIKEAASF
jgi:hypothetical protein